MLSFKFCDTFFPRSLVLWIFLAGVWKQAAATCSIPSELQHSWYRASDGVVVTFNSTGMTGPTLTAGAQTFNEFNCFSEDADKFVLGLNKAAQAPVDFTFAHFCWKLVKITDTTYFLYELTVSNGGTGTFTNQRVHEQSTANSDDAVVTPASSQVCTLTSATEAPTVLYKVSSPSASDVDVASIDAAAQQCPAEVFATYSYVKDSSACSGSNSKLDFCVDRQSAHIDYTACSSKILFSQAGVLSCLGSFTLSGNTYILLINKDTSVDNSNYYRFVCMEHIQSGNTETATVYAQSCTATSQHQLGLTRTVSCPITTAGTTPGGTTVPVVTTDPAVPAVTTVSTVPAVSTDPAVSTVPTVPGGEGDEGTDIVPIIVGVVVGVLAAIGVIALAVILYKKVYLKRKHRAVTPVKTSNGKADQMEESTLRPPTPIYTTNPLTTEKGDDPPRSSRLPPLEDVTVEKTAPLRG